MEFRPPRQSTQAAMGIILAGIGVTTLGATALDLAGVAQEWVLSVRLLALMTLTGPIVWLLLNLLQQRAGVKLAEQIIELRYPLRWFDQQIDFTQIAISVMISTEQVALVWLKPRRTAPGDEPLPPRPRLLISATIGQAQQCQQELSQRCHPHPTWTPDTVQKMARQRRWLRRSLGCLATPIVGFVLVLLIVQIVMAFLRI
ncbi:MAG: hypothetical protein H6673_03700 [Anaerolineales bacterium]|nr:hypothetical protein [Anaerolineales bacterium]